MRLISAFAVTTILSALPALAQEEDGLDISGSFRIRHEAVTDQILPGPAGGDALWNSRLRLRADYKAGAFGITGEIEDARAFGGDADTAQSTGTTNALEPIQLYLSWKAPVGGDWQAEAKAGRLTFDLGSRRLAGRNNYRNATNAYEGVHLVLSQKDGTALTGFVTRPLDRRPSDREGLEDNTAVLDAGSQTQVFSGLHLARPLPRKVTGEVYLLSLDDNRPSGARRLATLGARAFRKPAEGTLDFDLEAGLQTGEAGSRDVEAGFAHAEAGYGIGGPAKLRLAAFYDYATGDDPGTDDQTGFDSLFGPRRPDFGQTGLYGALSRTNISAPGLRLDFAPTARADGFVNLRGVWLAEEKGALARFGLQDASGASGDFVGTQIDGRLRYRLAADGLVLETGFAWLYAGEFLKTVPGSTMTGDTLYTHVDLGWSF